ncbi:hypothetical protein SAMN05444006_12322 [Allgaiera indica]|uniref:Secreted protein n=1 Tax=Allgaiera indica TaxID=765699 RepID=A0A1H3DHU0_9RHOB|nr:hypothetical protein SAMN05444006_12322 [Allgaiera indica]
MAGHLPNMIPIRLRRLFVSALVILHSFLALFPRLMMATQKKWRKLDGQNRLSEIIQGVEFRDGLCHLQTAA